MNFISKQALVQPSGTISSEMQPLWASEPVAMIYMDMFVIVRNFYTVMFACGFDLCINWSERTVYQVSKFCFKFCNDALGKTQSMTSLNILKNGWTPVDNDEHSRGIDARKCKSWWGNVENCMQIIIILCDYHTAYVSKFCQNNWICKVCAWMSGMNWKNCFKLT